MKKIYLNNIHKFRIDVTKLYKEKLKLAQTIKQIYNDPIELHKAVKEHALN